MIELMRTWAKKAYEPSVINGKWYRYKYHVLVTLGLVLLVCVWYWQAHRRAQMFARMKQLEYNASDGAHARTPDAQIEMQDAALKKRTEKKRDSLLRKLDTTSDAYFKTSKTLEEINDWKELRRQYDAL